MTTSVTPPEASWETAPSLVDGATSVHLTAKTCNLDYWFSAVAQGTLAGLVAGHRAGTETPDYMCKPGPLRSALVSELGFRSVAEEKATRAISDLVATAPDLDSMEFYATQLIDEARHSRVFRGHLVEMGVPEDQLASTIQEVSGADIDAVLLTVLVEGVLAPAAELSERKWRVLDPAAAEIERGAGIDEIRHLVVGSSIIREHLEREPAELARLDDLVSRGQRLWGSVPVLEMLHRRESLFQEGLHEQADVVGDYEIWPGRRLVDTSPEERIQQGLIWSAEMLRSRMGYMGLTVAA